MMPVGLTPGKTGALRPRMKAGTREGIDSLPEHGMQERARHVPTFMLALLMMTNPAVDQLRTVVH